MQRGLVLNVSRVAMRRMSTAAAPVAAEQLTLNFTTPHAPVYTNKLVEQVILPGASGEYGVTAGHSPLISQLEPGVVTVVHIGGAMETFFVPGGFALTHANSVTVSNSSSNSAFWTLYEHVTYVVVFDDILNRTFLSPRQFLWRTSILLA
jgi:hypothetical protein